MSALITFYIDMDNSRTLLWTVMANPHVHLMNATFLKLQGGRIYDILSP